MCCLLTVPQEFRVNRTASRISRGTTFDEADFAAHLPHPLQQHTLPETLPEKPRKASDTTFFQPLHMQFSVTVDVSKIKIPKMLVSTSCSTT
jgi:hypothetical protein